jgi:acyl carrier protein
MNSQNILMYFGSKLDLKIDESELYDYKLDTSDFVDLMLDVSENFDFQLDNSNVGPIIFINPTINWLTDFNYAIVTENDYGLATQNSEYIIYQV